MKTDISHEFEKQGRTLVVHQECIELFERFVDFVNQTEKPNQSSKSHDILPDLTNLPSIQKEKDTEWDAIMKLLQWALKHHPKKGLLPKEIDYLFSEQYRWRLSNVSARLGELLEQGKINRVREGRTFRYFSK